MAERTSLQRWSRRHRRGGATTAHGEDCDKAATCPSHKIGLASSLDATVRVNPANTLGSKGQRTCSDADLQALLVYDLGKIKSNADPQSIRTDIKEFGSLVARQGLFPCSRLASPQQLLLEHGLTTGFSCVLTGGARHVRDIFGDAGDLGLFDALRRELGRGNDAWHQQTKDVHAYRVKCSIPGFNGCGLIDGEFVHDLHGEELPALSYVLRTLGDCMSADILTWWVNIYEEGCVGLAFHHDHENRMDTCRWHRNFDVTAGASFGACRDLCFRHAQSGREFAFTQQNGDVFSFDVQTDLEFKHGIHRLKERCGPRISVIIMGKKRGHEQS